MESGEAVIGDNEFRVEVPIIVIVDILTPTKQTETLDIILRPLHLHSTIRLSLGLIGYSTPKITLQ